MNLKNKKIIITGATGGIGNSLVKKFIDSGSTVLATGTKEEKLNKLKSEFSNNIQVEKFNLGDHTKIESFIESGHLKAYTLPHAKRMKVKYHEVMNLAKQNTVT